MSFTEANVYATRITNEFKKLLINAALKSNVLIEDLHFNPVTVHSAVVDKILNDDYSGIPKTLYYFAKQAQSNVKKSNEFLRVLESALITFSQKAF